jgi:hypothetical protein
VRLKKLSGRDLQEVSFEDEDIFFTGTRYGLTEHQRVWVRWFLDMGPRVVRHGDCRGSDTEFHQMCLVRGYKDESLNIHPGRSVKWRAHNLGGLIHEPKANLQRNRLMVMLSTFGIACPHSEVHNRQSGTWYTIEYATDRLVPTYVIFPSGKLCRNI